jgi:glycosyltransferase involved in cell wall biosynthesis
MRCFYLDPGLRHELGHHAYFCRRITGALRRRGVETQVFASAGLSPLLAAQLPAEPLFRVLTYQTGDGDPLCGWLSGFDQFVRTTLEDMTRLPPMTASDLVYVSSARPVQVMAALLWYRGLPEMRRPVLVIEANETGLKGRREGGVVKLDAPSDPREDSRPLLFRYIGRRHLQPMPAGLHVITFDPTTTSSLGQLLGCAIRTVPLPYDAVAPLRNRAGAKAVTIACLGHQNVRKGYPLLPELIGRLLQRRDDIRLVVQTVVTGEPGLAEATTALQALAASDRRLTLDDQPAGADRWPGLLGQADLILCPYQPEAYTDSFSSMACEALANAIPVVVPEATTLQVMLDACGGPGLAFAACDVASILAATEAVLQQFDLHAERAYRAAQAWPERRGSDRLAEVLLDLMGR